MKYTLTSEEGPGLFNGSGSETVLTMTFNAHHLDTILDQFEYFLKGCGFELPGTLIFVDTNGEEVEIVNE